MRGLSLAGIRYILVLLCEVVFLLAGLVPSNLAAGGIVLLYFAVSEAVVRRKRRRTYVLVLADVVFYAAAIFIALPNY